MTNYAGTVIGIYKYQGLGVGPPFLKKTYVHRVQKACEINVKNSKNWGIVSNNNSN